ncbi:MAG: HEAT repeat domain-containing protein [Myxococcales bacterium]
MVYALIGCLAIVVGAEPAMPVKEKSDIYEMFQTDDALALIIAYDTFDRSVSPNSRSVALVEFWDLSIRRAQPSVRRSVIAYLQDPQWRPLRWSDELRSRLRAATGDPDLLVRASMVSLWKMQSKEESRRELIPYLKDPADEVRERAINVIGQWNDDEGREILRQYIVDNATKAITKGSVVRARFWQEKPRGDGPKRHDEKVK